MPIWALADPHLAIGIPSKHMSAFGEPWIDYTEKIEKHWKELVQPDDLVLIAGDISWAMRLEDALPDLNWIHSLPGTKVMIRGNHDFWWNSLSQMSKVMPSSIHVIQNNTYTWNDPKVGIVSIGGARLWDSSEYNFGDIIDYVSNPRSRTILDGTIDSISHAQIVESEKIFERELNRLEMSLRCLNQKEGIKRIVMTHYPPIGLDLKSSRASLLLEKYKVDVCVFGHLHNVKRNLKDLFGEKNGVRYMLTACDYLNFIPKLVYS